MATAADVIETLKTAMDAAMQDLESGLEEKDGEIQEKVEKIDELKQAILNAVEAVKEAMGEIKKELAKETVDTDEIDLQLTWMASSIEDLQTAAE